MTDDNSSYKLSFITTPHQQIDFEFDNSPYTTDDVILSRIHIKNRNWITLADETVKTFEFSYLSASSSLANESNDRRIYLYQLTVSDNCKSYKPYTFSYQNVSIQPSTNPFPNPGSKHQDIWGYYLPNSSSTKIPELYVYPGQSGIKKVSLYPVSGQGDEIIIPGANRLNENTDPTGVLSQISYPTGAVTNLEYEPHDFFNPITNSVSGGAGLRVVRIVHHDGITFSNDISKTYEYLKADEITSSGKLMVLPAFWELVGCFKDPDSGTITGYSELSQLSAAEQWKRLLLRTESNLNPDFDFARDVVVYERVTERVSAGKGKTVFNYSVPSSYGSLPSGHWQPTYIHIARPSCTSPDLNVSGYFYSPFVEQAPYEHAKGLLSSVAAYAEGETNPMKETIYQYEEKTISPQPVKGLRYEFIPYNSTAYYFMYGDYVLTTNKLNVLTQIRERIRDRVNSAGYIETTTNLTYGSNHANIATRSVANSDASITKEYFKYVKDYGNPDALTSDLQVNMIDAMNTAGQGGILVERTSSTIISGTEKTYSGSINLFENFGTASSPKIHVKETLNLQSEGLGPFAMSSFVGSGTSRSFVKHSSYKTKATFKHHSSGDLIRSESKRQVQSIHPDNLTGVPIAVIKNAEPEQVIVSTFDHDTDYDFDQIGFSAADQNAGGRTGAYGLAGWKTTDKFLKKQFKKLPASKYLFSAWYKPAEVSGTHSLDVIIRDLSNAILTQHTFTYTINEVKWHYTKGLIDLRGISNTEVIVEVHFSGIVNSSNTGTLDDVIFAPERIEVGLTTYDFPFGISSVTTPDGTQAFKEYDGNGNLKYIRDHDSNIIQKFSFTQWTDFEETTAPIGIGVPSIIYDNEVIVLEAKVSCVDISTLEWKITPIDDPDGGSFFSGTEMQSYAFTSAGEYIVTLKVSHSSYGSYETSEAVEVFLKPLQVIVCVTEGASEIDLCSSEVYQYEGCSGTLSPPQLVSKDITSFQASVKGCPSGGTYTYTWYKRPLGDQFSLWELIGTGSTTTVTNLSSYDVRCVVNSSCQRIGEAQSSVYIFSSDPNCAYSLGQ